MGWDVTRLQPDRGSTTRPSTSGRVEWKDLGNSMRERRSNRARTCASRCSGGHGQAIRRRSKPCQNGRTMGEDLRNTRQQRHEGVISRTPKATARPSKAVGSTPATSPCGIRRLYVEIKDAFKDIIISGGENISSMRVEMLWPSGRDGGRRGHPSRRRWAKTPAPSSC